MPPKRKRISLETHNNNSYKEQSDNTRVVTPIILPGSVRSNAPTLWDNIKSAGKSFAKHVLASMATPAGNASTAYTAPVSKASNKSREEAAINVGRGIDKTAGTVANVAGNIINEALMAPSNGATSIYTAPPKQFSKKDKEEASKTIAPVFNTLSPSQWGGVLLDAVTGQEINMPWSGKQTGLFGNSGIGNMLNLGFDTYTGVKGTKGTNNAIRSLKGDNIYLIRNIGDIPEVDTNGMFYASPQRNALANFTWDQSFRTHKKYRHRPGGEYMIFPNTLIKGKRFMSTDPMDTFIANSQFPANEVTIVSGNPKQLALAEQRGFKTHTSEELQGIFQDSRNKRTPGKISIEKDFKLDPNIAKEYDNIANQLIKDKFGRLSILDAIGLKHRSGINPHLDSHFKLKYNPSSSIEHRLGKQYGFPQHPSTEILPYNRINEILDELGSKPY